MVLICLAAISCPPKRLLQPQLFAFHHDEPRKLLVFATSQTLQLFLFTLPAVADFVRHGNAPHFWLSLVLRFLSAMVVFGRGVMGLCASCFQGHAYVELGRSEPPPQ